MAQLAFLYPGQGSQKVGMGSDLLAEDEALYDRYLKLADAVSGLPVRKLSLEGPIEELTRTDVTQPALFALSQAVTEVARDAGLEPGFVAGHSLGEYTAAVAAGALSLEDGMRLVCERGRLMNEIQKEQPGAMAAVIGLSADVLNGLCGEAASEAGGSVVLANLNSPDQIVVSGDEAAVEKLVELATGAGAKRALRLSVGAAFHSPQMKPVQERLSKTMDDVSWSDARVPLVADHSGLPVTSAEDVRKALIAQIASPVRWVDVVKTLHESGVRRALELGPGRVLAGLVRRIEPEIEVTPVDSRAAIDAFGQQSADPAAAG
jgi:[acyl-carrier-protein] S-malonyltransferase